MSVPINDLQSLQSYLAGVMERAAHHAQEVEGVVLALAGAVAWKGYNIRARSYRGKPTNELRAMINSKQYVFTYDHGSGTIAMRMHTSRRAVLHTFSNATSVEDVVKIFKDL